MGSSASKDLKQSENAETEAQEAIRLKPDYHQAYFYLGSTVYLQKKYSEALAPLQQAIRLKVDDRESLYVLGFTYVKLGKKEDAMQIYGKLAALDKEYALGLLTEINKLAAATLRPSPAVATGAEAYVAQGDQFFKANDHAKAIEAYKRAIALKPESETLAAAHLRIGRTYHDLRQDQNAVPALQEALRIKPDSAKANLQLGLSYLNLHQYPNALTAFQQTVRLKPDDAAGGADIAL